MPRVKKKSTIEKARQRRIYDKIKKTCGENQSANETDEDSLTMPPKTKRDIMRIKRQNPVYKKIENEKNKERIRVKRSYPDYVDPEKERNRLYKKERRTDKAYVEANNQQNAQHMQELRTNEDYAEPERERNRLYKRERRTDKEYVATNNQQNAQHMQELRTSEDYAEPERERNRLYKQERRTDKKYVAMNNQQNVQHMQELRKNEDYAEPERERNRLYKQERRTDKEYVATSNQQNVKHMQELRKNEDYAEPERERNRLYKQERRTDKEYVATNNQQNAQHMQELRTNEDYAEPERERNRLYKRERRTDKEYVATNNQQNAQHMQELRTSEDYAQPERERNRLYKRERRTDKEYVAANNQQNAQHMRELRTNEDYAKPEREKNKRKKRELRSDEAYASTERQRNALAKRVERSNEVVFHRTLVYNYYKNHQDDPHSAFMLKCIESRMQIPGFICSCCEGMFFERGVVKVTRDSLVSKFLKKRNVATEDSVFNKLFNYYDESRQNFMCHTCVRYIRQGKVPKMSSSNGLKLTPVSDSITRLNDLELRLLAPYIPFVKIVTMSHRGSNPQKGMKGNAVHVPVDVNEVFSELPRVGDTVQVVAVELKRSKEHKSNFLQGLVRMEYLKEAAEILQNSELYQEYGIKFHFVDDVGEAAVSQNSSDENIELTDNDESDDDDEYYRKFMTEDENCLLIDFNEIAAEMQRHLTDSKETKSNKTLVLAPGQHKRPESAHINPDIEFLSFPEIFGGKRPILEDKNISRSDNIKWDIRYHANKLSPERVLYLAKAKLLIECKNSVTTSCRKKTITGGFTAAQALESAFGLKDHNDSWKCMQQNRCSPSYMEKKKKELFAHIAQNGAPTFFITLSFIETQCPELIQALVERTLGTKITPNDALLLPYQERAKLVNDNPVFVAMYYDNKMKNVMKAIKDPNGIFKGLTLIDSFERREFQQRGTPHDHCLFWFKEAPKFDPENSETWKACAEFADKHITSKFDEKNPNCTFLRHKHMDTCSKGRKNKNTCRFGVPKFMFPRTKILAPLSKEEKTEEVKENLLKIKDLMECIYSSKERVYREFEDVLQELEMTYEQYEAAIRCALDRPKIIPERRSCDVDINSYNTKLLNLVESNIDVQYILDKYQTAQYIVDYVAKPETGLSKALKNIQEELDKGNVSVKEQLRKLTSKFLNCHLMSIWEAVYYCLGIPLTRFNVGSIFINTSKKEDRVVFLKSVKELEAMDPDSTDICGKDIITHYAERKGLEGICLAEFAAYIFRTPNKRRPDKNFDYEVESEDDETEDTEEGVKRRVKPRVIRFVRYNCEQKPDDYYREKLLLFLPWRNEEEEIESVNWFEKYTENATEIETNRSKLFAMSSEEFEEAMEQANINRKLLEEEEIAEFEAENLPKDQEIDLFVEIGIDRPKNDIPFSYSAPPRVDKQKVIELLSKLNLRQKEIVMHVYKSFRVGELPLRIFISGSAGVGKSMVIKTLYQLISYHLEYEVGVKAHQNLDSVKVLLTAFSGKAAFLIGGNTLHSAFSLPLQENANMPDLPAEAVHNLRLQLLHCKLIIIDEISMVGSTTFSRIDTRCRQITGVNESFGGLSLLLLGDNNQLPPVKDALIFTTPKQSLLRMDRSSLWEEFYIYELTEVMRQKGDLSFVSALNNFATGTLTHEDIKLFKTREVQENQVPDDVMRLYYTNADVENYNSKKIEASNEEEIECNAIDTITGKLNAQQKEKKLEFYRKKPTKECGGYPFTIRFKKGIKYMLTANLNVSDGLVNGATGTLEYVHCDPVSGKVLIVFLNFGDHRVGKEKRKEFRKQMEKLNLNLKWTPIPRQKYQMTVYRTKDHHAFRDQFPMVACEALTIHKSQGQTYESVCLDFRKPSKLTRQLVYVALSRVTSLQGLYILGSFPGNMKSNNTLTLSSNEVQRMRTERELPLVFNNLVEAKGLVVVYLNVQSLKTSLEHILSDKWYSRCDVLILAETGTSFGDHIEIPKFDLLYRSDEFPRPGFVKKNIAKGVMCFVKSGTSAQILNKKLLFTANNLIYEGHIDLFHISIKGNSIISGYKSPKAKLLDFKNTLGEIIGDIIQPTILMGDFNFNLNDVNSYSVQQFNLLTNSLNLRDAMSPKESTTALGSRLDVIFSNMDALETGVYECYFSDHKPIYAIVNGKKCSMIANQGVESNVCEAPVIIDDDNISLKNSFCMSCVCRSDFSPCYQPNQIKEWLNKQKNQEYSVFDKYCYSSVDDLQVNLIKYFNGESDDHEIELHLEYCTKFFKLTKHFLRNQPGFNLFALESQPDFEKINITPDGNCQFNAISYALIGSEAFNKDLRMLAFECVWKYKQFFHYLQNDPFFSELGPEFSESEKLKELLKICCSDKVWGIQDTLMALCILLKRIIYVNCHDENMPYIMEILPIVDSHKKPIVLQYYGLHYDVLVPKNDKTLFCFENTVKRDLALKHREYLAHVIGTSSA